MLAGNWKMHMRVADTTAFIDGLNFHGGLVGFDLGNDIARLDRVTFLDVPFGKRPRFHGRRQGGHQDLCRHSIYLETIRTTVPQSVALRIPFLL